MGISYFENLLSCEELGEPVLRYVVSAYGGRYPGYLARNRGLGEMALELFGGKPLEEEDRVVRVDGVRGEYSHQPLTAVLISSGNRFVLEAVLDSKESRWEVAAAILSTWDLSGRDWERLADRPRPWRRWPLFGVRAGDHVGPTRLKREPWPRGFGSYVVKDRAGNYRCVGPTRLKREPWPRGFGSVELGGYLDTTICNMGYVTDASLSVPLLAQHLGDGSDEPSLRRWEIFFGLIEEGPEIKLSSVLRAAANLAAAEEALC